MKAMKTYLIPVCCAWLMLAGCAGRDDADMQGPAPVPSAVRFGVASLHTKGNMINSVGEITSVGVFGYATGGADYDPDPAAGHTPNLLCDQRVTRNPSAEEWAYDPVAYWPVDISCKNSFFAYSPHTSDPRMQAAHAYTSLPTEAGNPTLTYTLPSDLSQQADILYAAPVLNKNRYSETGVEDGKVEYDMRHALSVLAFLVMPVEPGPQDPADPHEALYDVTRMTLRFDRIPVTATLDLGYTADAGRLAADPTADGAWTVEQYSTAPVAFEFPVDYDPAGIPAGSANGLELGQVYDVTGGNNSVLFFPVTLDQQTSGGTINVAFTHNSEEYYYFSYLPTVFMHAGYVTVYLVMISVDGISVEFKSMNRLEEWTDGNPVTPEDPDGSENIDLF